MSNSSNNLVFTTDIHLNFCSEFQIKEFASHILSHDPSVIVIGGDISEAPQLEFHLRFLEMHLKGVPVYFVCGNHDYYRGSIKDVRNGLRKRFKAGGSIWLPEAGIVSLSPTAALVGHDSWYDGGYPNKNGNYFASKLDMSDYHVIQELSYPQCFNRRMVYDKIQKLSQQGASHIKQYVTKAFVNHDKVFYVQHVSPFAETSCGPNKKMSDPDWMPHFCSRLTGEAIMEVMSKQPPEKQLIVLCGHSHTMAWHRPRPNVYCFCGAAKYGIPNVANQFNY